MECLITGCHVPIPGHLLLCRRHYHQLPTAYKRHIHRSYRRGRTLAQQSEEYWRALAEAEAYLEKEKGAHRETQPAAA